MPPSPPSPSNSSQEPYARQTVAKLNWAIIVAMATILLSISGAVLSSYHVRVDSLEKMTYSHAERIRAVETSVNDSERRLERIEQKLDRLLDQKRAAIPASPPPNQ